MQLCALNTLGELVSASRAVRHKRYRCLECGQDVRLRKGLYRQPHYYHTHPNRDCRQAGKGLAHLLVQYHLKKILPENEVKLEHRFNEINRIADVAWLPKQLVYEIQYSAISAYEVQARHLDYAKLGIQVIWVFYDKRYNQKHLTSAENFLKSLPHYFTNINEKGQGEIYDQYALIYEGVRLYRFPKMPIDLSTPQFMGHLDFDKLEELPSYFLKRLKHWRIFFLNDCIATCLTHSYDSRFLDALKFMSHHESIRSNQPILDNLKVLAKKYIRLPLQSVLHLFLERFCR